MKPMDKYDQPMLSAAGFTAGFSGNSWFATDRYGNVCQAHIDDKGNFSFRSVGDDAKWGPNAPMNIIDFRIKFEMDE